MKPTSGSNRSRALARHFFGNENPIGRYFRPGSGKDAPQIEIIGVAEDTKYVSLKDQTQQTIYVPLGSHYLSSSRRETKNFAVRLSQANSGHADAIRSAVREIDPKLRVVSIRSMNEVVESTLVQERLMAQVAGLFSLLALLLACVGLYGTMSHAVAQRTNEIGIRMALGARIADVIAMLMRETGWIVGTGVGIGLLGAAAVTRTVSTLLFGLTPSDPSTIAFAAFLLATAAAIAAYLPARRASRVDPIVALRHE